MKRLLIITLLTSINLVMGQSFGQNKVQYKDFDWSYIESAHFDIYYNNNEKELAEFTAGAIEKAYGQVSKHLRWELNKRVSVIVYNSHNDFQQTNVVMTYMSEGIGGVTELFKNRIVVPFEGSYTQFRHVIHHELVHAVVNDMIYGGNIQSIVSGRVKLNVPLWVNEGLAEYLSSNWDTKADMMLRDLAIHEYIPTVQELNYYFAYKGGQSIWRFIGEKYGREKVGEIFLNMKHSQNAEAGFKKALGIDYESLTDKWHKYLKKEYWPEVADRSELEDIAKRITNHKKLRNFYNLSPALSPDGSKIALLTDRTGYANIELIDAISGKYIKTVVKGNRSVDFEELKWLQPGVSWSPDGEKILFAAKAGKSDVLYIIDVKTGKKNKLHFDMDGLFTAVWSPDPNKIAFVGMVGRASDIFVYDMESKELVNLTNDEYSDSEPSWSPDGREIAFVSDRRSVAVEIAKDELDYHDYYQTDIFTVAVETGNITAITNTDYNENYPIWAHTQNKLLYSADYNGVWNLHFYEFDQNEFYPITNVLTGIQQLSLSEDDQTLVISGYEEWGWDLYSIANPLDLDPTNVEPTNFYQTRNTITAPFEDMRVSRHKKSGAIDNIPNDFSNFIFSEEYDQYNNVVFDQNDPVVALSDDSTKTVDGEYISNNYKTRFTLDVVNGQAMYNTVFGYSGTTVFLFSDILGDHQILFGTELVLTLKNSDYFFTYAYLKRRADFYITGFHTANLFGNGYTYVSRLRNYGISAGISLPTSRFNRFDAELTWSQIQYSIMARDPANPYSNQLITIGELHLNTILPALSWVKDNTVYGYTGPVDGSRQNLRFVVSPKISDDGINFSTVTLDSRKYFRFKREYSLAGRLLLGTSFGNDAQKFMLGGLPNWVFGYGETDGSKDNGSYRQNILTGNDSTDSSKTNTLKDAYFSVFAMPVRGTRYYERYGTNVALLNLELRFPFINYFALGFPFKMIFANIRGHVFYDVGAAWDSRDEFDDFATLQKKYGYAINQQFNPIVSSFGYGVKINLGYFLLRLDSAWDIQNDGTSKPQYYLSLGADW